MSGGTRSTFRRLISAGTWIVLFALVAATSVWGGFALSYRFPGGRGAGTTAAAVWALASLAVLALICLRRRRIPSLFVYGLLFVALLVWWNTVKPSNTRDWADEVGQMTTGTVVGNRVDLHNVRNFHWRTEADYDVAWEDRSYQLDQVVSVDLLLSYWSSPAIAHTLISFGFSDGRFVTYSVEIRKERGEAFSEIGGFFKQFETSVIAADERDIVLLRTNIRKEDVYLYRINMPAAAIRSLFLAYVEKTNELAAEPSFYNTVTANCTTIVYQMVARIVDGLPIDYRLLFSGYLPDYIATVGGFTPGFDLTQLRAGGAISRRGQEAGDTPEFSKAIRVGVPGIGG
ncbi:drug/metabolite transporter superfamily protein YnfA [Pararhizobium capsulatum DSM 1112]|uniref:Drug/metabolite transporter superfamily protein YnfA n=1 Tax=Pararhizobium capsulatum DSM 1112 TaxID=1121113 RepID=A0ABU0BUK8_9HYPH|nr:DUF4105 domain-containing protein [Pararhizobium capsulatum]MDQ0321351.1 drug/metabolite transporter superfamily protein YnfA [Pararhizobium capsulatum DSM 1112]